MLQKGQQLWESPRESWASGQPELNMATSPEALPPTPPWARALQSHGTHLTPPAQTETRQPAQPGKGRRGFSTHPSKHSLHCAHHTPHVLTWGTNPKTTTGQTRRQPAFPTKSTENEGPHQTDQPL